MLWRSTNLIERFTNINDNNFLLNTFLKKYFSSFCVYCTVSINPMWIIYLLAWLRKLNLLIIAKSAITQNWEKIWKIRFFTKFTLMKDLFLRKIIVCSWYLQGETVNYVNKILLVISLLRTIWALMWFDFHL